MFEDDDDGNDDTSKADAERIIALYERLQKAAQNDFHGLTRRELIDLWVDAEELKSWAMIRRLEAVRELQRRREAC